MRCASELQPSLGAADAEVAHGDARRRWPSACGSTRTRTPPVDLLQLGLRILVWVGVLKLIAVEGRAGRWRRLVGTAIGCGGSSLRIWRRREGPSRGTAAGLGLRDGAEVQGAQALLGAEAAGTARREAPAGGARTASPWSCEANLAADSCARGRFSCSMFASYQPPANITFVSQQTNNQPTVLFSQNKSAPAISHQPNEQVGGSCLTSGTHRMGRREGRRALSSGRAAQGRVRAGEGRLRAGARAETSNDRVGLPSPPAGEGPGGKE
jgi:hypothetical protein